MSRCIAQLSRKRRSDDPGARCQKEGRISLGGGRFVCPAHHVHGFVPVDIQEEVDEAADRAKRVLEE